MTVGFHAPVHLSLQLLLTPHAVGRDAISKGDEGQDPPAHEDALAHAPSGAPTEDRRPAHPRPWAPWWTLRGRQAETQAPCPSGLSGKKRQPRKSARLALVLGVGHAEGGGPQQDTETLRFLQWSAATAVP